MNKTMRQRVAADYLMRLSQTGERKQAMIATCQAWGNISQRSVDRYVAEYDSGLMP